MRAAQSVATLRALAFPFLLLILGCTGARTMRDCGGDRPLLQTPSNYVVVVGGGGDGGSGGGEERARVDTSFAALNFRLAQKRLLVGGGARVPHDCLVTIIATNDDDDNCDRFRVPLLHRHAR